MTDHVAVVLDDLVPRYEGERGDWERVLADAGKRGARRRFGRRRLVIALAVAAAIAMPLVAVGAAHDWWFFRFGDAPVPVTGVAVVKTGTWDTESRGRSSPTGAAPTGSASR